MFADSYPGSERKEAGRTLGIFQGVSHGDLTAEGIMGTERMDRDKRHLRELGKSLQRVNKIIQILSGGRGGVNTGKIV